MNEQQCSEEVEEVCGEVELAECREEQVGINHHYIITTDFKLGKLGGSKKFLV